MDAQGELDQEAASFFVFEKGDFCFDTACAGEPGKLAARAHDAVTGDQNRDRIGAARLPHGLRGDVQVFGDIAIGVGVSKGYGAHGVAHRDLKGRRLHAQGRFKAFKFTLEICGEFRFGLTQDVIVIEAATFRPVQVRDGAIMACQAERTEGAMKISFWHGHTLTRGPPRCDPEHEHSAKQAQPDRSARGFRVDRHAFLRGFYICEARRDAAHSGHQWAPVFRQSPRDFGRTD